MTPPALPGDGATYTVPRTLPSHTDHTDGDGAPTTSSGASHGFSDGVAHGASQQIRDLVSGFDPRTLYKNVKSLIQHPPSLFSFVKSLVTGLTYFDDIMGVIHAFESGDEYEEGVYVGKLLVEVSGDVLQTIVGGAAGKISEALKGG